MNRYIPQEEIQKKQQTFTGRVFLPNFPWESVIGVGSHFLGVMKLKQVPVLQLTCPRAHPHCLHREYPPCPLLQPQRGQGALSLSWTMGPALPSLHFQAIYLWSVCSPFLSSPLDMPDYLSSCPQGLNEYLLNDCMISFNLHVTNSLRGSTILILFYFYLLSLYLYIWIFSVSIFLFDFCLKKKNNS